MGGGVSLIENMQEVMVSTILIGRAISAVSFPGMYRIYDFHSSRAPKLKNAQRFAFFAPDSDDEDDEIDESNLPDPAQYAHLFKVTVGDDIVYIENPITANEAGWTPLHSCCMSTTTVSAGLALIEETLNHGGDFETKTKQGPGTFNRGWTPLHMACAYGVEALVEKLVANGADVNSVNSFGFSCLLEACHRGFINIVRFLVRGPRPVNFSYIPSEMEAMNSPFSSAPCQSALAEAARCGFNKVVQILIDAGAPKDLPNNLGWTALHEACFYNRVEIVKTLLLAGANSTLRTRLGALPFHLAGLTEIRNMLKDMGGEAALPTSETDTIDMVDVLTELTMPETMYTYNTAADGGDVKAGDDAKPLPISSPSPVPTAAKNNSTTKPSRDSKESDDKQQQQLGLLHSGPMLGDLPSLSPVHKGPGAGKLPSPADKKQSSGGLLIGSDLDLALGFSDQNRSPGMFASSPGEMGKLSRKADDKKAKKSKNKKESYSHMPAEYLCQLTRKPMSDPVKTIYNNVYDRSAITKWLSTQGKICPLTGAPLSEVDLTPVEGLGDEIRAWILKESSSTSHSGRGSFSEVERAEAAQLEAANITPSSLHHHTPVTHMPAILEVDKKATVDDDLYDF
mmetsp:Transcript_401/g.582  ORF Transcript_401/g.582 Transcript_401/m.582 type:complete len:624 (+) Transcript_401:49-1920(+)